MGQTQSIRSSLDAQTFLLTQIHEIGNELSKQYSQDFLNPDFCDQLALIYNDKLMQFRKQELDNIQYSLGIKSDNKELKRQVCDNIVNHYTTRLQLISTIEETLNFTTDRINAVTVGPKCVKFPNLFDQGECNKAGGTWEPAGLEAIPDKNIPENVDYNILVMKLQQEYLTVLRQVLKTLKNFKEDIDDRNLKKIITNTTDALTKLKTTTTDLYATILSTKKYTKQEADQLRRDQLQQEQTLAAKTAALREVNKLPVNQGQ